jgi:hypothetical protein
VDAILGNLESATKWRRSFLAALPAKLQLELLKRLITFSQSPQPEDWPNVFHRVKFDFASSLQYRLIVLTSFLVSVGAITESLYLPFQAKAAWTSWLFTLPVLAIVYGWIFVWKGLKSKGPEAKRLDPNLFLKFWVLGCLEFWQEFRLLLREKTVWAGVETFHEIVTSGKFITLTVLLIIAGASVGASANADTGPVLCAIAGAVVIAITAADGCAVLGVVLGVILGAVADTSTGAEAGAVLGAGAGAGISFWYKAKKNPNNKFRFLAILAYPFFCSALFVVIYGAFGLHNWCSWPIVASIWIALSTGCIRLWQWGQAKERKARNPLQGILDGYVPNPNLDPNRRRGLFTPSKS